jgi:hypothetical protein
LEPRIPCHYMPDWASLTGRHIRPYKNGWLNLPAFSVRRICSLVTMLLFAVKEVVDQSWYSACFEISSCYSGGDLWSLNVETSDIRGLQSLSPFHMCSKAMVSVIIAGLLGIQVTQSLVDFYASYRDRNSNLLAKYGFPLAC